MCAYWVSRTGEARVVTPSESRSSAVGGPGVALRAAGRSRFAECFANGLPALRSASPCGGRAVGRPPQSDRRPLTGAVVVRGVGRCGRAAVVAPVTTTEAARGNAPTSLVRPDAPRPRRKRFSRRSRRDYLVFLAFAGPNLLLIALFTYPPLLSNIFYSTLNWTLGSQVANPVGLGNCREFFSSPDTKSVLVTTA